MVIASSDVVASDRWPQSGSAASRAGTVWSEHDRRQGRLTEAGIAAATRIRLSWHPFAGAQPILHSVFHMVVCCIETQNSMIPSRKCAANPTPLVANALSKRRSPDADEPEPTRIRR